MRAGTFHPRPRCQQGTRPHTCPHARPHTRPHTRLRASLKSSERRAVYTATARLRRRRSMISRALGTRRSYGQTCLNMSKRMPKRMSKCMSEHRSKHRSMRNFGVARARTGLYPTQIRTPCSIFMSICITRVNTHIDMTWPCTSPWHVLVAAAPRAVALQEHEPAYLFFSNPHYPFFYPYAFFNPYTSHGINLHVRAHRRTCALTCVQASVGHAPLRRKALVEAVKDSARRICSRALRMPSAATTPVCNTATAWLPSQPSKSLRVW